jgi:hypothetical protein
MSHNPAEISAQQKLEEMMDRVRSLPPGGDLASLLTKEITELAQIAEKQAIAEREAAREGADFPPSGEPLQ